MVLSDQVRRPCRLQKSSVEAAARAAVFVGRGTKWANPFKKSDVDALRSEPDVEIVYQLRGWREAAKLLYVDHLREEGLDFRELRGMDLVCTCTLDAPCHADVLLELANLE
jgi:hypothetical protein